MYKVGQYNTMHICLTTLQTHIVFKELHEGMVRGHFVANITTKKIWMQVISGKFYSTIFINFAKVVIVVRKSKD